MFRNFTNCSYFTAGGRHSRRSGGKTEPSGHPGAVPPESGAQGSENRKTGVRPQTLDKITKYCTKMKCGKNQISDICIL